MTVANAVHEIPLEAERDLDRPWDDIEAAAEVTDPAGTVRTVPAFWDGGRRWRLCYSSPLPGTHRWRTVVAGATETGLEGREGEFEVEPYAGDNPLPDGGRQGAGLQGAARLGTGPRGGADLGDRGLPPCLGPAGALPGGRGRARGQGAPEADGAGSPRGKAAGKSDPIDALAVARAALREGPETLPPATSTRRRYR